MWSVRVVVVVVASLFVPALAACVVEEELGEAEQLGTLNQGTLNQGTLNQGTLNQGTLNQGSQDGVWGVTLAGWSNSGMALTATGVSAGKLAATWHKSPACGGPNTSPMRTCDWYGGGVVTCAAGATVSVAAGACAAGVRSMVRVCAGAKPCAATAALAASDAACAGAANPTVSFRCPAVGSYFAMVAPKNVGLPAPFPYTVKPTPTATVRRTLGGAQFDGTTFDGVLGVAPDGALIRYRVVGRGAATLATGALDPFTDLYRIVQDADGTTPLCAGPDNRAVPLTGRWRGDGTFVDSSTHVTLACRIGVIAKCYLHGYRPWAAGPPGASMRDLHQTCTRAARADFCGDGTSYTVTGTPIDLYDRFNVSAPVAEGKPLEAIWAREGTGETSGENSYGRAPVCLSKRRWDSMPYEGGGLCPGLTNDPRVDNGEPGSARYCEDSAAAWFAENPDNVIATDSGTNGAGLWRWKKIVGVDYRTTAACTTTGPDACQAGYLFGKQLEVFGYEPPREPVFLGGMYPPDQPADLLPENAIPLYTLRHLTTGEHLTTTDATFPGYGPGTLDGYILDDSCEETSATVPCPAKRLDLVYKDGDYLTTTPLEPVLGYTGYVKTLGYLLY